MSSGPSGDLLSKRRVATRPQMKNAIITTPSHREEISYSSHSQFGGQEEKEIDKEKDREGNKQLEGSEIIPPKRPIKLYFGSRNINPFTIIRLPKRYFTSKTSLIHELKSSRPNINDLLYILENIKNSVNERDDDGTTSLMLASSSEVTHMSTIERLAFCRSIQQRYPKQFELVDNNGLTALHHAVQFMPSPSLRIVKFLISAFPAAASICDNTLSLPLHHAVVGASSNAILRLLVLAYPASVSLQDGTGTTALEYVKSKMRLPSRQTRALLSIDGVWVEPTVFTTTDVYEPDPEEIFAVIFIQTWYRQILKQRWHDYQHQQYDKYQQQQQYESSLSASQHDSSSSTPTANQSNYKKSIRPKPKAPIRPPSPPPLASWNNDAATMIQALYRGSFLRLRIARGKETISNFQRIIRGYLTRKRLWKLYPIKYLVLYQKRMKRMSQLKASKHNSLSLSSTKAGTENKFKSKTTPTNENWEKISHHMELNEREEEEETERSTPIRLPPSSSLSSSSTKPFASIPIWKKLNSHSTIRSYWLRYQTRNLLPSLSYHHSFQSIVMPFYLELLLGVLLYLIAVYYGMTTYRDHFEKTVTVSPLPFPIENHLEITFYSLILSLGSIVLTSLSISLYRVTLPKKNPITYQTKLFHSSYRSFYLLSVTLSLLSMIVSWCLLSLFQYLHWQHLFNLLIAFDSTLGGIFFSILIIPLILFYPGLFLTYYLLNRKWSRYSRRPDQKFKQMQKKQK